MRYIVVIFKILLPSYYVHFLTNFFVAEDLHEAKILDVLHNGDFSNPDWKRLGSALGLSPSQLDSIAADKRADNTAGLSNALINMLSTWMKRDVDSSWGKLAEALAKLGETTLSDKAQKQQGTAKVLPSLNHIYISNSVG